MSFAISATSQSAGDVSAPVAAADTGGSAQATNVAAAKIAQVVSTPPPQADVQSATAATKQAVAQAAQQIQEFIARTGRELHFSVDQATGFHVVQVINPHTQELVRQLPADETLRIAKALEFVGSALVNQKA